MIDPTNSLAFSIQANKGIYALLLGSGVSRAAKIPTGWEVTIDLIRKLSEVCDESCEPSPEDWYRTKFGHDPDYSDILAEIAKTQAERQQLLRRYWEPTEQEREEGLKQPTAAHRAIASLVEQEFIKVIITTNFDRLMETALIDVGITPTVLSTPDQVTGALPLIHTRCCVFKVNGDYLDARIRNTTEELSSYPSEFNDLLRRIFDEFGLIVCGWSAEWDGALCKAIFEAPSRRFTTYWTLRSEPTTKAEKLINHRQAQQIVIDDADTFFLSVQQQVQSLEEYSKPHPLSTDAAVASLKRYISESRFNIQLADLVNNQTEKIVQLINDSNISINDVILDEKRINHHVRFYDNVCDTLLSMAVVGGFWAKEEHYDIWIRTMQRLAHFTAVDQESILLSQLQKYPATLLLYSLGLGAIYADNLSFLYELLTSTLYIERYQRMQTVDLLPPSCLYDFRDSAKSLQGMEHRKYPLNCWLYRTLRESSKKLIPSERRYELVFDKLEIMIALGYAHLAEGSDESLLVRDKNGILVDYWVPGGIFVNRVGNFDLIIGEILDSIYEEELSPYVQCKIIGDNANQCERVILAFANFIGQSNLGPRPHF
jgi:hypothetical protein